MQISIFFTGSYNGVLQKLIRKIKYDDDKLVGLDLGMMLSEAISKINRTNKFKTSGPNNSEVIQFPEYKNSILVPVPLHKKRLRERGYNQAEVIAKEFNKQYGARVDTTILKRLVNTKPQFDLGVNERKSNVVDAFSCTKTLDASKTYIVIDDVFTTGTTISECVKQLIINNAKRIVALSVARTP